MDGRDPEDWVVGVGEEDQRAMIYFESENFCK